MSDEEADEDWFERALREDPEEGNPDDWEEWAEHSNSDGDGEPGFVGPLPESAGGDGGAGTAADQAEPGDDAGGDADEGAESDDEDESGGSGGESGGSVGESGGDEDDSGTVDGSTGNSLFEDDFGAAMGGAPDIGGGAGGPAGSGEMGMDSDMASVAGDLDVSDEFSMDTDFGMGGGGGGFDADEEFDTDLPRIDLGIDGLDEMIQGGVPERSLMVTIGSAGTGKTTFGLQFLHRALEKGERAIYVTLEESRERVINSATEKGLEFDEYAENGQLAVVDLDPVEMANSLRSIRSELPRLIESFDATRLVLDSVSLLEMMYDDRAKRRNEIYDFTRSLKRAGVTTMLTSEASDDNAYTSRHGIVEYLTDAVFVLQYVRPSDFRETRLAIEIQKIRDANHSRETKPYEITNEGISVYRQANIF